ncbi:2-phospho-L-lactate guanylyltransferase [Conexibacter sp. SYSU D00693]|uniref:2-phospho-L-lactate guanylyltransferase n=1 Tax=Conexibacter sp. SYSU D00693 TaxID=2812560 RepID=UPI00196B3F41|nr:2-phospho-L-lactate guanylyltransferase [Conexibacter sp. SYSU D00693]
MSQTIAVLPVKRFGAAKQRLFTDGMSEGTKRALAEAMVTDVLIALRRSKRIDTTLVVTGEPAAEALAGGYDASVVADPSDDGHSAAALRGVKAAIMLGAERVVLLPGDCPALVPAELDDLVARAGQGPEVLVVPDRHGTGTNALVLTPPGVMEPSFGPGSRERHEDLAARAGARSEVVEVPSLMLDVDTLEDLGALREALARVHGNAANTRGLLARFARVAPPPPTPPE